MTSAWKTWITIAVIVVVALLIWWYVASKGTAPDQLQEQGAAAAPAGATGVAEVDAVLAAFGEEQSEEASLAAEADADQTVATGDEAAMTDYTATYNENEVQ